MNVCYSDIGLPLLTVLYRSINYWTIIGIVEVNAKLPARVFSTDLFDRHVCQIRRIFSANIVTQDYMKVININIGMI